MSHIGRGAVALAVTLLACELTSYTESRDAFRDNVRQRLDAVLEQVVRLSTSGGRSQADPDFRSFIAGADAELQQLRTELAVIDAVGWGEWPAVRVSILLRTGELERRLGRAYVGEYP